MRIIYPRPTVWVSHPLIALTPSGKALIKALKDQEIQDDRLEEARLSLGRRRRSRAGRRICCPRSVPASIDSILALPQPAVMDRIVDELSK